MIEFRNEEILIQGTLVGEDLVVVISGGDKPHIGAVAICLPSISVNDSERKIYTLSHQTFAGHKEGELALKSAEKISKALDKKVVLTCGIHFDQVTRKRIKEILQQVDVMTSRIINKLLEK